MVCIRRQERRALQQREADADDDADETAGNEASLTRSLDGREDWMMLTKRLRNSGVLIFGVFVEVAPGGEQIEKPATQSWAAMAGEKRRGE